MVLLMLVYPRRGEGGCLLEIRCIGGSKGGARDAPPRGSKFFHFHAVFSKNLKNNSNFGSLRTPLGKILDPPLRCPGGGICPEGGLCPGVPGWIPSPPPWPLQLSVCILLERILVFHENIYSHLGLDYFGKFISSHLCPALNYWQKKT